MSGNAAGTEQPDPQAMDTAADALSAGQPIVLPTDTVYGVAVLLSTPGAAETLSRLKSRSAQQSIAVLVASTQQALELSDAPSMAAARLMAAFWPGPLTLVLRRRPDHRDVDLGGDGSTIGVRCPDHGLVRALASRLGPIVTTSANRHGQPTPTAAAEAANALARPVAVVIDGGVLAGKASTVVDCTTDPVRVLREGAITTRDVLAVAQREP